MNKDKVIKQIINLRRASLGSTYDDTIKIGAYNKALLDVISLLTEVENGD